MHVCIDIRALMDTHISGVAVYTQMFIAQLPSLLETNDRITFWYNSKSTRSDAHIRQQLAEVLQDPRVTLIVTRASNKVFACTALLPWAPDFFVWLRKQGVVVETPDVLFMPDIRPLFPTSVPLVSTIHDLSYYDYPAGYAWRTRLWHALVSPRRHICKSTHCIAVSHFTKQRMLAHTSITPESISVIHEAAAYTPPLSPAVAPRTPFFVTLCTLEPRKNLRFTLEQFLLWKKETKHPHTLYVLGDNTTDIFRREALPVHKDIYYVGRVSEAEKYYFLQHATALLYISHYEGFGLPVVEAACVGTPSIVGNTSSLQEVGGDGCIAIHPTDAASYHDALTLLIDSKVRTAYSTRASIQAKECSWEKNAQKTWKIFQQLANKN